MSNWRHSLAGRMIMLLAAALFIGQAINLALLLSEVRGRRATFTEGGAIARTIDTVERVQGGLPVGRVGGGGPDRLSVAISAEPLTSKQRDVQLERRLTQSLKEAGQDTTEVRSFRENDGSREYLIVAVRLHDGRWVNLRSMLPPGDSALIVRVLVQTLIIFIVLLVAIFLIIRHVSDPLRQLTRAAERLGTNQSRAAVALKGPADIQNLIETFNRMQARILEMLHEKDLMLGAIGHDLRTPLASLRIRAEAVGDEAERQRMVETIEEMASTLEDILSLARSGRSTEPKSRVDLGALVDALVQDLQDLGMTATVEADGRLPVLLRPHLIRRALRNLIENAVTYGSGARVEVRRDDGRAVVTIDDDGPGIPEQNLDWVMEGFVRLEPSRNRATGGSGLGLAIAHAIVTEHGGELELRNRAEGGLRAILRLPLA